MPATPAKRRMPRKSLTEQAQERSKRRRDYKPRPTKCVKKSPSKAVPKPRPRPSSASSSKPIEQSEDVIKDKGGADDSRLIKLYFSMLDPKQRACLKVNGQTLAEAFAEKRAEAVSKGLSKISSNDISEIRCRFMEDHEEGPPQPLQNSSENDIFYLF